MSRKDPLRHDPVDVLGEAYELMLERVLDEFRAARDKSAPALMTLIDKARDTATELGELSREEAERVAAWLRRDLDDLGGHLARTGGELRDWLGFETELIESRLLDLALAAGDPTRLQLARLDEDLAAAREYRSGEIAGPGTLQCDACGERLTLRRAGRIPPCPRCHGSRFHRARNA